MNFLIFFVLLLAVFCQARHIHPPERSNYSQDEIIFEDLNNVEIEPQIDMLNLKPTRFVPINSVLFFKTFEPCEEGFQRDALGVCREVWD